MGDEYNPLHFEVNRFFLHEISKEQMKELIKLYENHTDALSCLAPSKPGVPKYFQDLSCVGLGCDDCIFGKENFEGIYKEVINESEYERDKE